MRVALLLPPCFTRSPLKKPRCRREVSNMLRRSLRRQSPERRPRLVSHLDFVLALYPGFLAEQRQAVRVGVGALVMSKAFRFWVPGASSEPQRCLISQVLSILSLGSLLVILSPRTKHSRPRVCCIFNSFTTTLTLYLYRLYRQQQRALRPVLRSFSGCALFETSLPISIHLGTRANLPRCRQRTPRSRRARSASSPL